MIATARIGCALASDEYVKVTSDGPDYLFIKTVIDYDCCDAAELDKNGVQELIDVLTEWQGLSAEARAKRHDS